MNFLTLHSGGEGDVGQVRIFVLLVVLHEQLRSVLVLIFTVESLHMEACSLALLLTGGIMHLHLTHTVQLSRGTGPRLGTQNIQNNSKF